MYDDLTNVIKKTVGKEEQRNMTAGVDPGGGGTPLYGLYRYVRPQREEGIDFIQKTVD